MLCDLLQITLYWFCSWLNCLFKHAFSSVNCAYFSFTNTNSSSRAEISATDKKLSLLPRKTSTSPFKPTTVVCKRSHSLQLSFSFCCKLCNSCFNISVSLIFSAVICFCSVSCFSKSVMRCLLAVAAVSSCSICFLSSFWADWYWYFRVLESMWSVSKGFSASVSVFSSDCDGSSVYSEEV